MNRLSGMLAALCVAGFLTVPATAQEPSENGHKKTIVTHTGKVVTFERSDPAMVVVKTDKAEINAQLAPMTFIEEQKLLLNPDEEITIKGYETTEGGKTIFVVTEVTAKDGKVIKLRGADFKPLWAKVGTTPTNGASAAIVTLNGTVTTFEKADPAVVVLKTDKGEINAELAPMTFIEEQKLMFAPGDAIIVRGYETTRDGNKLFVVTEVTTKDKRVVRLRNDARAPVWVAKTTTIEKPGDIRDITGAVTVVETVETPDGRLVRIKADGGERVIALGPGSYLEKNRYMLKPGETIYVKGWEVDRSGKRVFLATEIKRGGDVWRFRRADGTVLWE